MCTLFAMVFIRLVLSTSASSSSLDVDELPSSVDGLLKCLLPLVVKSCLRTGLNVVFDIASTPDACNGTKVSGRQDEIG